MIGALSFRAAVKAALSCGRRSRASGSLAGLNLGEGLSQGVALGLSEAGERGLLGLEAQAGAALAGGADPGVGDGGLHNFRTLLNTATSVAVS